MKKILFAVLFVTFFFVFSQRVNASLVRVDGTGEAIWKVLGEEDALALGIADRGSIEVKESVDRSSASITLTKQSGKLYLNDLDVTDFDDDLIEIEERGAAKKVIIGSQGDKFTIEQNGVVALTDFPINIRPIENELSVTTTSGNVFLGVLPLEAAESALRSRFMSRIPEKTLEISEAETGLVAYRVNGEKVIDFFNMFEYPIAVTAQVSASTGEILAIDGPEWFKIFGFLFT